VGGSITCPITRACASLATIWPRGSTNAPRWLKLPLRPASRPSTSITPHEFVTRLRIDRAKKLLLAGNHSVTDICFDTGYESLGSFSTRFHSLTGLSPAAFRRESRRVFGSSGRHWPLYYMPACFQHFFAGIH
jgi:hypothetical protein